MFEVSTAGPRAPEMIDVLVAPVYGFEGGPNEFGAMRWSVPVLVCSEPELISSDLFVSTAVRQGLLKSSGRIVPVAGTTCW